MAIQTLIRSGDTIKISKSFGIVGSAVITGSKVPIVVVAANNNEPITQQEMGINKPLVKMINALASIDGMIKQRLENQKIISANQRLSQRESQVEQQQAGPQIEVIQPDAEKVSGSGLGALAVGGLLLLTLDPVQEAIKDVFDGVASMGRFVTGVVSSINDVFKFFVGGSSASVSDASTETPAAAPREGGVVATPAPPAQEGLPPTPTESDMQAEPTEKPSFFGSVASSALTGAAIGSFIPKVGTVAGAAIGGAYGAFSHAFTGGSSDSSPSTSTSSPPPATGGSVTPLTTSSPPPAESDAAPVTPEAAAVVPSEIPKNDIVALGNYLIGKGADRSKMEHQSLSGRVGEHSANSRHYRGMAIDVNFSGPNEGAILDALEPQLRAAGYNTIWRQKDHYTHMHVSVGGPEGGSAGSYGDTKSLFSTAAEAIGSVATASLEQIGELFGSIGGAIVDPGIPRTDIGGIISNAAKNLNTEIVTSRTEKPVSTPTLPTLPKLNKTSEGAAQNASTSSDGNDVYYYFRRFGFQDLNAPESSLMRNTVTA